ncbi:MAG: carbohydrate ABC transporter permease [Oscillospiraceae bacterium]|jgi:putative aldouronate transport system permease protein|nr:carbohydrate ABC transporter permease [Oscillospiraceae bacterium]
MMKTTAARRNPNRIRQRRGEAVFEVIVFIVLTLIILFLVYPFYNCLILAFNDGQDALNPGIYLYPRMFSMENILKAVQIEGMASAAFMSVTRTIIGTVLSILVCAMFGYAVSKPGLKLRSLYMVIAMIPMFFSGGMIPSFLNIRNLGLYDNFLVYILPTLFSTFYAIIFLATYREVPPSLEESAILDGANQFTIFYRIIMPISKPTIAAISVFTAVGHWNSWMDTMLYTGKKTINTLAYMFSRLIFQTQYLQSLMESSDNEIGMKLYGATSTSIMVGAMVIATLPIAIIYPFFQKHFAKGVMIGSIKG